MDLGTTAAIVGIVAALVYVVETAFKYGPELLKKSRFRIRQQHSLNESESSHFIRGSYSRSTKIQPGFDVDILIVPHHGAILKKSS